MKRFTSKWGKIFPGENYVDMIVISNFNRCGLSKWHTSWNSFEKGFSPIYRFIKTKTSVEIGVAEVSTTDIGGDKSKWFLETFDYISKLGIKEVTWFLDNKEEDGKNLPWALNTDDELKAFKQGRKLLGEKK